MDLWWIVIGVVAVVTVTLAAMSARVIQQYEKGLVFRFGRLRDGVRGPGLTLIAPVMDRLRKVNMQITTMPVPAQDGITRDNVTVRVDAVVYFRVLDPVLATVNVQDYTFAVSQVAQTSLRSVIGKSDLDDLLSNRERLNQGLELMIDSPALDWGIHIDRVEVKDVALPEAMKRSMSRQAEAERERRARVISADGELQASEETRPGGRHDGGHPGGPAIEVARDDRLRRGGEELHPGPALPRRVAALSRAKHAPAGRTARSRPATVVRPGPGCADRQRSRYSRPIDLNHTVCRAGIFDSDTVFIVSVR